MAVNFFVCSSPSTSCEVTVMQIHKRNFMSPRLVLLSAVQTFRPEMQTHKNIIILLHHREESKIQVGTEPTFSTWIIWPRQLSSNTDPRFWFERPRPKQGCLSVSLSLYEQAGWGITWSPYAVRSHKASKGCLCLHCNFKFVMVFELNWKRQMSAPSPHASTMTMRAWWLR